ncbi:hypothetical protein NO2_0705 [Candidatus Termititenax persephonae]|uniref:Uncharacterized protein n=1 Tax=Candidatus Termititenax persephonae TaxID=2218525 RepID=A0A388TH13_9BACT|nr:hypothetical protein NO2_0705 [Candidatus Termititenax persephonae]
MQKNKNKNLKSFGVDKPALSHREAVENGKKGGVASGEARRETAERIRLGAYLHGLIDDKQADIKDAVNQIIKNGGRELIGLMRLIIDYEKDLPPEPIKPPTINITFVGKKKSYPDPVFPESK